MTARGAGFFAGGIVSTVLWTAILGWDAALAYTLGLIAGPTVYNRRAPWRL